MKLLLGVLGFALGAETSLRRSTRQAGSTCDEIKQTCNMDVADGIYSDMAECLQDSDMLGVCAAAGDDQCQNYQYDGFKLCCPDGLDVDHFWPRVRTTLQRGPRPLAPGETCPNGCDVASTVDKFVCAYFKRVGELKQLFEELETFTDMDLKSIIDFKRQFVRRYNEVNAKSQRSLSKMMEIQQLITSIVRVTQENDILIKELEGEVAQVQIQVTSIDTDLANLHQFCKVGKQCAKQCYFPPELFGGIKKDCAEYYHSNYWQQAGNPSEWFSMPQSGIYIIQPSPTLTPKYAYCDQKTDGGGWTLLQHKGISNSSNWDRYAADTLTDPENPNKYRADWHQPMSAYKNGFGWLSCNGESDYWVGLDYMSAMSYRQQARLRIDLKDWDNADYWGYYDKFFVLPESRGYKLIADQYSGVGSYSIGDAWGGVAFEGRRKNKAYTQSSGMKFSTKDVDNDNFCIYTKKRVRGQWIPEFSADDKAAKCDAAADHEDVYRDWETNADFKAWGSCAGQDGAGFWYNRCSAGNLNGHVYQGGYYKLKELAIGTHAPIMREHDDGLIWGTLGKGRDYSFMLGEMRIRPKNFQTRSGVKQTRRGGSPMEEERTETRG